MTCCYVICAGAKSWSGLLPQLCNYHLCTGTVRRAFQHDVHESFLDLPNPYLAPSAP